MPDRIRTVLIIVLIVVMLLGILMAAYPIVSNYLSRKYAAQVKVDYQQQLEDVGSEQIRKALDAAVKYNRKLYTGQIHPELDPVAAGYFDILDPTGSGIMGYVEIPKIHVNLPIYHGISSQVLQEGAGHMSQTSLPCGSENAHAAISAHTGLASAPMFTDLVQLEVGDVFFIHVLGERLAYEVDQVLIVEPTDVSHIGIVEGRDLVTLITCTPYGINSHRLLVRGHRTTYTHTLPDEQNQGDLADQTSTYWRSYLRGIFSGAVSAIILAACVAIGIAVRQGVQTNYTEVKQCLMLSFFKDGWRSSQQ